MLSYRKTDNSVYKTGIYILNSYSYELTFGFIIKPRDVFLSFGHMNWIWKYLYCTKYACDLIFYNSVFFGMNSPLVLFSSLDGLSFASVIILVTGIINQVFPPSCGKNDSVSWVYFFFIYKIILLRIFFQT